jgi:hypothetical protein
MRRLLTFALPLLLVAGAAAADTLVFCVTLDGSHEVSPVVTPASGTGTLSYDTVTKMLAVNVTFGGLSSAQTGAHIHGPATPAQNAGVIFPLPLGSPINVVVGPLDAAQEGYLTGGLMYINVHTEVYPSGEIRGVFLGSGEVDLPVAARFREEAT